MTEKDKASILRRGKKEIEVEREEDFFTAVLENEDDYNELANDAEIREVRPLSSKTFVVHAVEGSRDRLMDHYRKLHKSNIYHHAYKPKGEEGSRYYLTEQINLKFKVGVTSDRIEEIIQQFKLQILRDYVDIPNAYLVKVTSQSNANPLKISNELAELEDVEYAEPDLVERFQMFYEPDDDLFQHQWHLKSWNGPEVNVDADVSATQAWDLTKGDRSIVIAVIDDGFDLTHPDFQGQDKIVHPKDYTDGDANPFPIGGDYHGTPCAGVAIAEENDIGVVGIAPGCAFMPIRFPLNMPDSDLSDMFNFVGKRSDVISCSWGPIPANAPVSSLVEETFRKLTAEGGTRGNGVVICFAAGNYNAPTYDPGNTGFIWRHPGTGQLINTTGTILNGYAAHPDTVAVSASTSLNKKSTYSNWGKEITVCAPSNNFHPIDRGFPVAGRGIWTTDNEQFGQGFTSGSRFTGEFGGTSSATPLVAGTVGLIRSANPQLTAHEVIEILKISADKIVDLENDIILGHNKGTYDAAGHSEWFGFGKVNAFKAVQFAQQQSLSFEIDIKPLFRPRDVSAMINFGGFDLASYDDVSAYAESILQRLEDGTMPCDGTWSSENINKFRQWIEAGKPV